MKKLMNILFLSCLKATELIEKKLRFKLSFSEKIRLVMHKSMCEACTNYEKQSLFIDTLLDSTKNNAEHSTEDLKKNIADKMLEDKT